MSSSNPDVAGGHAGETAERLLVQRLIAGFWLCLAGGVFALLSDLVVHRSRFPALLLVAVVQIGILIVLRIALMMPRAERRALLIALAGVATLCVTTAVAGFLRHDTGETTLFLIVTTLAAAMLLPWGVRAQLGIVLLSGGLIASGSYAAGNLAQAVAPHGFALAVAFAISLYAAYELDRHRGTIEQRTRQARDSERFARSTIDALSAHIAILDEGGAILRVNRAWRRFGSANGARDQLVEGTNYLAACDAATGPGAEEARAFAAGTRAVVAGEQENFSLEYPCHSPSEQRWFIVRVTRFARDGDMCAVVAHEEVSEQRRAQQALRLSEQQFRSLIEHSSDLAAILNADGTARYHSPSIEPILGYRQDELRGTNVFDLVHPDDRPALLDRLAASITTAGYVGKVEYRFRHKDGSWRTFEAEASNLLDDPAVAGIITNSRDITERKRMDEALRRSEEYLKAVFDYAPDAFYLNDAEGRFVDGNRAAEALIGYSKEELIGESLLSLDILPADQLPKTVELLAASFDQPTGPTELILRRKDNTLVTVEVRTIPLLLNGQILILGIARDISERKRAEQALRAAKEAAEAASRAKSEFVANMSHEIRTPLNGVIGMTELALDTQLTAEQREYLEMARGSADSLLVVINDILDFSKIEAGKLDIEAVDFDLRKTIAQTMRTLAQRAHKKGLEVTCSIPPEIPPLVAGDPGRLRQVLLNLAGNAIKFTEHGEVAVSVDRPSPSTKDDTVELHFSVSDTGIGIPAGKRQAIFNAFEQVDGSTTRTHGGTGLGLAIASQLVRMMGGRIWVESEQGHGSVFHFTATLGRPERVAVPQGAPPVRLHGLPVLVVDDNATNRRILEQMLLNWRMRPTLADGGRQALTRLRQARDRNAAFPLILLDSHMPEMDGFAVAERIRQDPTLAGATIMMLTSDGQAGDVTRCRELGIATYLLKPITQSDLLDAVLTALEPRRDEDTKGADLTLAPPAPRPDECLHVLLAEDNAVNQRLVTRLLEKRGHHVTVVGNGAEAIAVLERTPFDVVLMDVQMPEVDGFAATAEIRRREGEADAKTPHTPIIALTAHAMKGDEQRCLLAGMDAYLSKPIQIDALVAAIARVVPSAPAPTDPPFSPAAGPADVLEERR